ncbi:hypothetical protein F8M41_006463 [Gigaspora margarita]|uniref:Uncharacterized protein n=1 Tax=Gigaspora margarita TaxID=4874 RepID=A0A8H4A3S8_GIGMA|nr:hypothetical protein F8M41_006463 [Gigaspora margarita]
MHLLIFLSLFYLLDGYENVEILSSYPELNVTIPLLFNDNINISILSSIAPSSGNISVYQIVNQNTLILRQIYPASSYCLVYNKTLSCRTLSSTFNRINSNYTIVVDDNFVTSLFNEPLREIKKGVWNVMTSKYSTEALLRLNSDGSSYFSSYNQSQLLDDLLQQIKQSIPLINDHLKIIHNVQSDPSDFSKLLVEFLINKATNPLNEPSINDIVKDLNIIIKNKYISTLADKQFMIFLDDQYGFQIKLINELCHNVKFLDWFTNNVKSVLIFTIIASTDVTCLNILSSNFAGFNFLSALISKKAEMSIIYGAMIDLLIEDIPQLIIQACF